VDKNGSEWELGDEKMLFDVNTTYTAMEEHCVLSNSLFFLLPDLLDQRNMLKNQLAEINARPQIQEPELSTIDDMALRQRLERRLE